MSEKHSFKNKLYRLTCLFLYFFHFFSEFQRIINRNLTSTFYASLDKYNPQLLQIYKKSRTGIFGMKLEEIMMAFEVQGFFFNECTTLLNVNNEH